MTTGPVDPVTAGHGRFRASDADRERVIETLKVAFAQGRLTRDDLDQRAGFYARVMDRVEQQGRSSIWSVLLQPNFGRRLAMASAALVMLLGGLLAIAAPATYEPKPFLLKNRLRWLSVTATALGGGVVLAKAAATPISALAALLTGLFFVPVLLWMSTSDRC